MNEENMNEEEKEKERQRKIKLKEENSKFPEWFKEKYDVELNDLRETSGEYWISLEDVKRLRDEKE